MKILVLTVLTSLISSTAFGADIQGCISMIEEEVRHVVIDGQHVTDIKGLNENQVVTANVLDYRHSERGKISYLVVRESGSVAIPLDEDLTCSTGSVFGNRSQFIGKILEAYIKNQVDFVIEAGEYTENGQANRAAILGFDARKNELLSVCRGISIEIDRVFESYEIPEKTRFGAAK